jgi:hypothetical protein
MKPYTFSGHDTFALRHGWLQKIYDCACQLNAEIDGDSGKIGGVEDRTDELFDPEIAMAAFGVGKNMVRSMRYWAFASNFLSAAEKNRYLIKPLGHAMLAKKRDGSKAGLDPFFEHPASLWLLHWEIATNAQFCTAWDFAFSTFARTLFKKEDLSEALKALAADRGWKVSDGSIEKDVNCILQMYCADLPHTKGGIREESAESPLAELRLISRDSASGGYRFEIGAKNTLPPQILYYAIAQFSAQRQSQIMNLDEIFYDHGSPGRVFKLDENSMCSMLELASDATDGALEWQETGPLRQLKIRDDFKPPLDLLADAYATGLEVVA